MKIVNKTILRQIITQCAGTQNIIENLASCDPCGRKSGLKTVTFLLRLSIYTNTIYGPAYEMHRQACAVLPEPLLLE